MAVITINLGDEQIEKARIILRELREQQGEGISRSEVFRLAIDALFLSMRLTDKMSDVSDLQPADVTA